MRHRPLRLGHAGTMLATQAASCHKQVQRPSGIALLERDRRRASAVLRHRRPSPKLQPKPSMPFTSSGGRTESVWKHDIRLDCKALRLKAKQEDPIEHVHVGQMNVAKPSDK